MRSRHNNRHSPPPLHEPRPVAGFPLELKDGRRIAGPVADGERAAWAAARAAMLMDLRNRQGASPVAPPFLSLPEVA
jgi:hypothetical protein